MTYTETHCYVRIKGTVGASEIDGFLGITKSGAATVLPVEQKQKWNLVPKPGDSSQF